MVLENHNGFIYGTTICIICIEYFIAGLYKNGLKMTLCVKHVTTEIVFWLLPVFGVGGLHILVACSTIGCL